MAEMTAEEAIRMALKFNQFDVAGVITCMTTQLDGMKQKESAYKQVIESKKALIEQQAAEIGKLNDKADAMRCCANCISHHVIINESKCFEGLPIDEWRFSKRAKPVDCDYVCDKWKWLEKEAEVHG